MSWSQIIFGAVLVVVLLAMAVFVGWQQLRTLRGLVGTTLPEEDRRYERRKALRRLVSCGLLLILAGLLGALLTFYEHPAQKLADERHQLDQETAPPFTPQQRSFLRVWVGAWIAILLVLLAVLTLAAIDLWETRRHGLNQFRRLQADRRAMIARQAERLRQERQE